MQTTIDKQAFLAGYLEKKAFLDRLGLSIADTWESMGPVARNAIIASLYGGSMATYGAITAKKDESRLNRALIHGLGGATGSILGGMLSNMAMSKRESAYKQFKKLNEVV